MFALKMSRRRIVRARCRLTTLKYHRRGTASVEAAFCIPLVILLMLGTLEVCAGIYLAESLKVTAYEACRAGVRRETTKDDVYQRAVEVLALRNVTLPSGSDGTTQGIVIEPNDFSSLKALDPIKVTITAPTKGNSIFIFDAFLNRNVSATVTMVREFDN